MRQFASLAKDAQSMADPGRGKDAARKLGEPGTGRRDESFLVLGVAMVVDQIGVGPRLIARYPTQPSASIIDGWENPNHDPASSVEAPRDDLFFTLTPRRMAKLFRTKKSLCGRPTTLSVNGTVFCSHSVLMDADEGGDGDTANDTSAAASGIDDNTKNRLALFSVIVALSAPTSHTSVPFSSLLDGATEDQLDLQRYLKEITTTAANPGHFIKPGPTRGSVSAAFLAIRRVHISLSRYCRVLEREERRCQYVSMQADRLSAIRNERRKKWEDRKSVSASSNSKQGVGAAASPASVISKSAKAGHHRRGSSFVGGEEKINAMKEQAGIVSVQEAQRREQEILELMLAAPPVLEGNSVRHRGNLARELVQFFHSLSRNDLQYPPTAAALLSERDGVVYVNQHIAIPVEAATLKATQLSNNGHIVRPYLTLLFPQASPSELLQAFQESGSAPPQRLQQVLLTVNPQKPLTEIAVDANLPMHTTMEIASYLVARGACVSSPVVSRSSRLACFRIEKIPELALEFSQTFANVDFFRLVSFLTSSKTLGKALLYLTGDEETDVEGPKSSSRSKSREEGTWLRECLAPSGTVRQELTKALVLSDWARSSNPALGRQPRRWIGELEELLFAMAVWLLSHRVLTQMQDYLVVADMEGTRQDANSSDSNSDALYRELLESNFLNGDVSVMALSWRLGIDQQALRSWGLKHSRIRVVSRIPGPSDDWESESS